MHICFLTGEYPHPDFPHGGVGTFIQTLGKALVKKGIKVSVVGVGFNQFDEQESDEGVEVYRLSKSSWKKFSAFDNFKRLNAKLKEIHHTSPIDIIEGTELSFAFIKKIPGIIYLIRMHGGHHFFSISENRKINPWKGFQEKRSFRKADYVIGVSKYVSNHTLEYIDYNSKFKGVIFNPANLNRFYKANLEKTVKGRIFFAGTVCEKKGIRQLVQAMPLIKKEVPEAHLLVAGREWIFPDSGRSYLEYLKTFIHDEIRESITFLGAIPNSEIPKYIESAEVCCYPSHMEAMPLAWIEVMSMGKPFVGSKLGPGPEIVEHGKTGLLCNPLDPFDIAEKVIFMMKNPEAASKMGDAAREFAIENFDIDKIVDQNIHLYRSLCGF